MALLILPGCDKFPKPPKINVFTLDLRHGICQEFEMVDQKKLIWKKSTAWPIEHCDGFFALAPESVTEIRNYFEDTQEYAKNHCK